MDHCKCSFSKCLTEVGAGESVKRERERESASELFLSMCQEIKQDISLNPTAKLSREQELRGFIQGSCENLCVFSPE